MMNSYVVTYYSAPDVYACKKFEAVSLKEAVSQWVRTQEPEEKLFSIIQDPPLSFNYDQP